jgi:hypothetical protein
MAAANVSAPSPDRLVTPETLSAAPVVVGQPLAEPWRRFAAIAVDVLLVATLSILSRPWLGIATGAMLMVLFGRSPQVALSLKLVRLFCRAFGAVLLLASVFALGQVSMLRPLGLDFGALADRAPSAAMRQEIMVAPDAGPAELQRAVDRLENQVSELKKEIRAWQRASGSWQYQVRTFTNALGITFGWSGVYFTLLGGALGGRTPGKLLFGTRAAKINGQPFTFFDAFVRQGGYVAGVAMGMIGFLHVLWEPNRRAVEDRIAGTVVLKTSRR